MTRVVRSQTKFVMTGLIAASGDITSLLKDEEGAWAYLTLSNFCFRSLFSGCTSLTSAPKIPIVVQSSITSCAYMFNGCTQLSRIEVEFSSWPSNSSTSEITNWVRDVAPTGTFICPTALGTNETITRGESNCPEGWTVVNPPPNDKLKLVVETTADYKKSGIYSA